MTMLLSLMLAAIPMPGDAPPMPQDLAAVPVIDGWLGRKISPRWSETVAKLYRHGDCSGAVNHEGSRLLEIDMLFLLSGDGKPMKIAPVNARCPDVETFVSKRILGTLSGSFPKSGAAQPVWMRSQVRFLWSDAP
ncbi:MULTISPECIES: hypothetical protein [Sphingobium]|uniref:TonB C-terminal domain-containing protein n=2 Tax=Sphingobium cupriresistens TaxID=1132417 RepID=A0A0J7XZQ2_9SPHN|nr:MULTISPECIES: hypothetical protein [Sphingobium]KMS57166.1 hypothetical protein V473_02770 [Sphingobium cupriresistens LL01]MBJ7378439.1 hypothetical protein [Sphingobium sp.]RYM09834.1 hypothetical protein EWH12_13560 [Sphingobium cupriresistens]WCP14167.1 hypothetical protein sphantq_02611 [Sphingobium sp. AntQ-1]